MNLSGAACCLINRYLSLGGFSTQQGEYMLSLRGFAAVSSAWLSATVVSFAVFLSITSPSWNAATIRGVLLGALASALVCSFLAATLQTVGATDWQAGIVVGVALLVSTVPADLLLHGMLPIQRIEIDAIFAAICVLDAIAACCAYNTKASRGF